MGQVLNMPEGSLRIVQGSATADSLGRPVWGTATAPSSALFPYMQEGMQITSGVSFIQVKDRGRIQHHLYSEDQVVKVTFTVLQTGAVPTALTASGASVPFFHAEYKMTPLDVGSGLGTGRYIQFYAGVVDQIQYSEAMNGNKIQYSMTFGGAGPITGSGYLS